MDDCNTYNYKLWHYVFPPLDIFRTICLSDDKTRLFLSSLVRLLISGTLFYQFWTREYDKELKYAFLGYFLINLLLIIIVYMKVQRVPKDQTHKYLTMMQMKKNEDTPIII